MSNFGSQAGADHAWSVFRARHAAAAAAAGEPERAVSIAGDAVTVARGTRSARLRRELLELRAKMSPWAGAAAGRELAALLAPLT